MFFFYIPSKTRICIVLILSEFHWQYIHEFSAGFSHNRASITTLADTYKIAETAFNANHCNFIFIRFSCNHPSNWLALQ